eukprot:7957544-Pyramimonas_sp.AAC.1
MSRVTTAACVLMLCTLVSEAGASLFSGSGSDGTPVRARSASILISTRLYNNDIALPDVALQYAD